MTEAGKQNITISGRDSGRGCGRGRGRGCGRSRFNFRRQR